MAWPIPLAMECPVPECKSTPADSAGPEACRALRPWVQTGFLGVWLAPLGQWLHGIPGCVFHCYSCPLSSFACPVGVAANYAALLPVAFEVPYLLIGVLLLVGAAQRFARLRLGLSVRVSAGPARQDLDAKKISLPGWVGLHPLRRAGRTGAAAADDSRLQRHSVRGPGRFPSAGFVRRARWKPACRIPSRACWPATAG